MTTTLRAVQVTRDFASRAGVVHALSAVDLDVSAGELVVLRGASGAGKSTLLNLLSGLDRPTSGALYFGNERLDLASESHLVQYRRDRLGIVFQSFGLLPVLTAAENIEIPLRISAVNSRDRAARVAEVLELVGLSDHAEQLPEELSGGQQQRVGIARALVSRPAILLADEPTAQLDSANAATIMNLLAGLVESQGVAAVISTHDDLASERATKVLTLSTVPVEA